MLARLAQEPRRSFSFPPLEPIYLREPHITMLAMKQSYRCWAEIDRAALRHNAKVVRDRIGSAEMLAVVKANAYGHGLLGVAQKRSPMMRNYSASPTSKKL